jgi:hypothetical protein
LAFVALLDSEPLERCESTRVAELRKIVTAPDLVFDAWVAGPADAPLVLLLHGFSGDLEKLSLLVRRPEFARG